MLQLLNAMGVGGGDSRTCGDVDLTCGIFGSRRDDLRDDSLLSTLSDRGAQRADIDFTVTSLAIHGDLSAELGKASPSGVCKRRWFVLKNDLYYFEGEQQLVPKGVILLNSDVVVPQALPCDTIGHKHALEVRFANNTLFRGEHDVIYGFLRAFSKHGNVDVDVEGLEPDSDWEGGAGDGGGDGGGDGDDRDGGAAGDASGPPPPPPPIVESEPNGVVDEEYSGYLERHGFKDNWKRQWFVLKDGSLTYFDSEEAAVSPENAKGTISLDTNAMRAQVMMLSFMRETNTVVLTHHKSLILVAGSEEERDSWLHGLQEAIDHVKTHKAWLLKNPTGWKRSGKVREVVVPLVDMLRDPLRCEFFEDFLKDFGAEHYLRFWLDVQQFKRLCKKEQPTYLRPHAEAIYNKYIKIGAEHQIDITDVMRESLESRLFHNTPVDTFKECQRLVLHTLYITYYPIYLTSNLCKEMAFRLAEAATRDKSRPTSAGNSGKFASYGTSSVTSDL